MILHATPELLAGVGIGVVTGLVAYFFVQNPLFALIVGFMFMMLFYDAIFTIEVDTDEDDEDVQES